MGRIRRRHFLIGASALFAAKYVRAQQLAKLRTIAFLEPGVPKTPRAEWVQRLIPEALVRLGYEPGKNVQFEFRFAEGKEERLSELAREFVRMNVDLIVTIENNAALAAKRATQTIPIVMASSAAAVEERLVASYAHPGGNITGLDWIPAPDLAAKRYEFLRSAIPNARRIVRLRTPTARLEHLFGDEYLRRIAANTGFSIVTVEFKEPAELPGALRKVAEARPEALNVAVEISLQKEVAAFALDRKLPSIAGPGYAAVGGLLAHIPHIPTVTDRIASYIDRILRGTKPAELPVEQPTKYSLVLNTKTAKTLGLNLQSSFLLQVDQTIE